MALHSYIIFIKIINCTICEYAEVTVAARPVLHFCATATRGINATVVSECRVQWKGGFNRFLLSIPIR